MAACPVSIYPPLSVRRSPLMLTQRRLEANRRNAARSTGPRTPAGKARVARNPIKHGFFVAQEKWTPEQQRDFATLLEGFSDEFKPQGALEESCLMTMAESYVRMAAMLRFENTAALKHHQYQEREMEARIAAADEPEASRLRAQRSLLRRAGLWKPVIPAEREARAICRYSGRLDRAIRGALSRLEASKSLRNGAVSSTSKVQKQTHYSATPNSGPEALRRAYAQRFDDLTPATNVQKQTHYWASPSNGPEAAEGPRLPPSSTNENEKTNPLSSMFTGNRHERRRAKALARRQR